MDTPGTVLLLFYRCSSKKQLQDETILKHLTPLPVVLRRSILELREYWAILTLLLYSSNEFVFVRSKPSQEMKLKEKAERDARLKVAHSQHTSIKDELAKQVWSGQSLYFFVF